MTGRDALAQLHRMAARNDAIDAQTGMTLRDYFAAKAMQVEIETASRSLANARALCDAADGASMTIEQRIAFNAYAMADAMLAMRERKGPG